MPTPDVHYTDVEIITHVVKGVFEMRWGSKPNTSTVIRAYESLTDKIQSTDAPIYVIVDIRADPAFPLQVTINNSLRISRQQNFNQWLVVGSNRSARMISSVLNSMGTAKILWFDTVDDALDSVAYAESVEN
ncbi:MAG: hypothetical protein RIC84_22545 [Aggregatilineales bacterium]